MASIKDYDILLREKTDSELRNYFPITKTDNVMVSTDKTLTTYLKELELTHYKYDLGLEKLNNIEDLAEVNQNAYSKVKFGFKSVSAKNKTDTLSLAAGENISIDSDENDAIVISSTYHEVPMADEFQAGKMSRADYIKLQGIESYANNYIHPKSGVVAGLYSYIRVDDKGHIIEGMNEPVPVELGGTGVKSYTELGEKLNLDALVKVDNTVTATGKNPVSGSAVYDALLSKAEKNHGLHVPDTSITTSDGITFLANNNTWQSVRAASITQSGVIRLTSNYDDVIDGRVLTPEAVRQGDAEVKSYVDKKFSDLIGGAPETLDTIYELASVAEQHTDLLTRVDEAIGKKVDKVDGKGLSTNDYTTEDKNIVNRANTHMSNTSNPHNVTKTQIGLSNVTNDKQVKGLSSGTTEDNVVVFGADGYSIKDSGHTIKSNVPENAKFTDTIYTMSVSTDTNKYPFVKLIDSNGREVGFSIYGDDRLSVSKDAYGNIKIDASGIKYNEASESGSGFMSKSDYIKLKGIEEGANKYVHPTSGVVVGTYLKVSVDKYGHVISGSNEVIAVSEGGTGANNAKDALINLGIKATATEINYLSGVTANIQDQLSYKVSTDTFSKHTHPQYSTTDHTHSIYSTTAHSHSQYSLTSHTHSYLPLSGGTMIGDLNFSHINGAITWNGGDYRQRIQTVDDSTSDTAVFSFQQSSNAGSSYTDLMVIRDNGKVIANTFVGSLSGNATSATSASTASSLTYFKNTSTTNVGIDDTSANAIGYVTGTSSILSQNDGAIYKQCYSSSWTHEIYGDYRTGQIAVRAKNNGTWQAWRKILDSSNYTSYCTPANIGAATSSHTHSIYSPTNHSHSQYSVTSHTHSIYSTTPHTHSQYSLTSHTHSYLPLSGGTLTGAVTCNSTITFGADDAYGIRTASNNTGSIGDSTKYFSDSYINNMHANRLGLNSGASSTASYIGTIYCNTLTEHRQYSLPDSDGQIVLTHQLSNYSLTNHTHSFTDVKVTQTAVGSDYTSWRPLVIGSSNSSTEGFSPSTVTDGTYTTANISCQPSSGTIRATTFKGSLSGKATSATYSTSAAYASKSSTANYATNSGASLYPYGFDYRVDGEWGNTTGTSITGWYTSNGCAIDFRKDNPSEGKLSIKVDGRVYINEGTNPVMGMTYADGYWGMGTADGSDTDWIRTTSAGILPYQNGTAGSGHCSLGTSSWYFSRAYIDIVESVYFHGQLQRNGNAVTNTVTDGSTNFSGGTTLDNGASLVLRGKDQSGIEGRFELRAIKSGASTSLVGYPDGGLTWGSTYVLHSGNYSSYALPKSGGTLTGGLTISEGWSNGLQINASSGSGIHIYGDNEGGNIRLYAPSSADRYWEIDAHDGNLRFYTTPVSTWSASYPLYIASDTIIVSKINNFKINSPGAATGVFNGIPVIASDGVMEVGRFIDFHYDNTTSTDNTLRIQVVSDGTLCSSGSIKSDYSIYACNNFIIGNATCIYPDAGSTTYGLKFTYFSNPILQIIPNNDAKTYLGHSSYRFYEVRSVSVYISAGTAVTSDRNYKNTINELDEDLSTNFIMSLKPSSFKYNDGESGRLHYGLIAQDVEDAMNENNISSKDFAGLIIEKLTEPVEREVLDDDGNVVIDEETGEPRKESYLEETGEIKYDLRYDEFIAPMIKVIQKQNREIEELEKRISTLESMLK